MSFDQLFLRTDGSDAVFSLLLPSPSSEGLAPPKTLPHSLNISLPPGTQARSSLSIDHSAQRPALESQLPHVYHENPALTTQEIPFVPVFGLWEQRDFVHLAILEGGM